MADNNWMHDPSIQDISKEKLDFLQKLVFETEALSAKERMPFFMALASRAKQAKISFEEDEINRIIAVIKKNSSAQDVMKMDQMLKVFQQQKKK